MDNFKFSYLLFPSAVQHERGPRKPKSKPISEMTSNAATIQDLRSGRPLAPSSMPEPRHGSTPPSPPITLVSSSMYYGTFYHSLLTAEQCNVSPMALDLSSRSRDGKGHSPVRVESSISSGSSPECLPEVAARLLFSSVKWAKSIPCFRLLPFRDQVSMNSYFFSTMSHQTHFNSSHTFLISKESFFCYCDTFTKISCIFQLAKFTE